MAIELQLALDDLTRDQALKLVGDVYEYVDIVEIGTPFIIKHGISFIGDLKKISDKIKVLCDTKIMDAGFYEAEEVFKAGADYVTILALTDNETLRECVKAARKHGGQVMADMICVPNLGDKVKELEEMGVDIISVHTGVDQQRLGRTPVDDLCEIKKYVCKARVAVAGGIRPDTIGTYMQHQPDIIIVGGGIAESPHPVQAAREICKAIKGESDE